MNCTKKWARSQIWPMDHSLLTTALNLVHLFLVHCLNLTTTEISNWNFLDVCTLCGLSTLTDYKEGIYNHLLW